MKIKQWWWLASVLLMAQAATGDELTFGSCQGTVTTEYLQRADEADIKATVENPDCGASLGSYIVEATIKADGATETEKLRFEETWQRDDDQPVIIEKRYPIGDDVELKRIRIRKVACTCSEAPSDAE